jgi:pantothenate kinase
LSIFKKGFDELLELAEKGDNKTIDMLVKDIYGGDYEILGLKDDLIASSFGKATRSALDKHDLSKFGSRREELLSRFKQEDIIKSVSSVRFSSLRVV